MIVAKLFSAFKSIQLTQLSLDWNACHLCGWKIQIKTHNDEIGVRCTRCFASPVAQVMGQVFNQYFQPQAKDIYELSSRGAFVRYLQKLNANQT